jgi:hypothetical protein
MCARVRERLMGPAMLHTHLHDAVAVHLGPLALHEASTERRLANYPRTQNDDSCRVEPLLAPAEGCDADV